MNPNTPIPSTAVYLRCLARLDQIDAQLAILQAERDRLAPVVLRGRMAATMRHARQAMRRKIERDGHL